MKPFVPFLWVLALAGATPAVRGGPREVFGDRQGIRVQSALPGEKRLLLSLLSSPSGGVAGAGLCSDAPCAIQSLYADPLEGNGVLLVWRETGTSQDPVTVLIDGVEVCDVPPLPAEEVPGYNACLVSHLPLSCVPESENDPACSAEAPCRLESRAVDARIFELRRADGVSQRVCQEVIGGRPMAVEAEFCCRPGEGANTCAFIPAKYGPFSCDLQAESDDCDIIVGGGNTGPPPSVIEIQVEDDGGIVSRKVEKNIGNVFCFQRSIPVSTRGSHPVDIFGLVTRADARFLSWYNEETGVSYDGLAGSYLMSFKHQVTTSCGKPRSPKRLVLSQAAYAEGAGNAVRATWELEGPYLEVQVYLDDLNGAPRRTLPGDAKEITLESLPPGVHTVGVAGDGGAAGGGKSRITQATIDLLTRPPGSGKRFIRGLCNGELGPAPDITSAIFGLNYLFVGGRAPPCKEACDVNGDGALDISDLVALLDHLFTGGRPPAGWTDVNSDGQADPSCQTALAGEDCGVAHDVCP